MKNALMYCMLIFALIACTTNSDSPEADSVKLKLGWRHGVQFLGYYVAQQQGFYEEEGLEVQIDAINEFNEVFSLGQSVANGEYDFSMSTTPLALEQAEGVPVTTIATILQFSPQAFFARTDSGIQTPSDFAGHRVAVTASSTRAILTELLAIGGLTEDDVEIVESGFDMTPFYEGDVDIWVGYLTNEVIRARQQGIEVTTFPAYEYGIRTTEDMLFAHQDIVQNNPDLAIRFVRASIRGWQWAIENPASAVDIMLEVFPEMVDERDFYLASFDSYIPLIRVPGKPVGSIDCDRWLSQEAFADLETANLCTTEIFEQAGSN